LQVRNSVCLNQFDSGSVGPHRNDRRIDVNPDGLVRGSLVPHDRSRSKVAFDVGPMRGHQVDQLMKTLTFSAGISHTHIIVNFDDDCK
jgi:hypothetical protein